MKHIILLWLVVVGIITACVAPGTTKNQKPGSSFVSPLIPATNLTLVANRWQLIAVQHRGMLVNFAALKPIYIWFDLDGTLSISSPQCAGGAYRIVTENERRYKLTDGMFGGEDCGEIKSAQFGRVTAALEATTEYNIKNNQLLLTGADVRLVFEIDNQR